MRKANVFAKKPLRNVNPDWFTGKVHMTVLSGMISSKKHDIYHVTFERGAKTKLHTHDGDQILLATKGRGSLEVFSKKQNKRQNFSIRRTDRIPLLPGDMVFIPRNTLHTHGSTDRKRPFSHIAFNIISGKTYKTTWYESDFAKIAKNII